MKNRIASKIKALGLASAFIIGLGITVNTLDYLFTISDVNQARFYGESRTEIAAKAINTLKMTEKSSNLERKMLTYGRNVVCQIILEDYIAHGEDINKAKILANENPNLRLSSPRENDLVINYLGTNN